MRLLGSSSGLILGCLALLAGCDDGRPKVYSVRGKVLIDQKPVKNVQVVFYPVPEGSGLPPAGAMTDENGEFSLDSQERQGAPAGDYVVTFAWREASGLLKNQFDGPDRLKGKYSDPKPKLFPITVKPGNNDLPPFELTTK